MRCFRWLDERGLEIVLPGLALVAVANVVAAAAGAFS